MQKRQYVSLSPGEKGLILMVLVVRGDGRRVEARPERTGDLPDRTSGYAAVIYQIAQAGMRP